jgi:hypothetical protein
VDPRTLREIMSEGATRPETPQERRELEQLEADLESIPAPVDGVTLDASRDMTFLQQRKWSSGTKQTHRFRLAVDHIPEGQAENVTVGIIQSALKKVAGLEVDGYDARLSDARAKQIQTELLKGAIADARDFATTAATEARIKLGAVRSVRIGGGPSLTGAFLNNAESMTVVSRAFSVRDNLASKIRVAVDVTVDYDCERP